MNWKWLSLINSNHWSYESKLFFELILHKKLSFIRIYTQVIWRAFSSLGFLVQHFVTILFGFSVWSFTMKFNPLPQLLNNWFTIIESGLFYGGKHLEEKICKLLTFFDKKRLLLNRGTPVSPMCKSTSNTGWVLLILH